jgi:OTU domain-containing protein 3
MGLYAAPTVGDGNCLFRALSDQLYGSEVYHPKLRTDICDWIENNKVRYEPFVEDERGLQVHLRCMRENGKCCTHFRLRGLWLTCSLQPLMAVI